MTTTISMTMQCSTTVTSRRIRTNSKQCTHLSRSKRAFTLVELLVVIAIIGVLVALLLPAIQAARESARRNSCKNNLKQIGLAVQSFHDAYSHLPPARYRNGATTWFAIILPFVESQNLNDNWDFEEDYYSVENQVARETGLSIYRCPSREGSSLAQNNFGDAGDVTIQGAVGDYAGNAGNADLVTGGPSPLYNYWRPTIATGTIITAKMFDDVPLKRKVWKHDLSFRTVTDGLSNTLLAVEKHVPDGAEDRQGSLYNGDNMNNCARIGGLLSPVAESRADTRRCKSSGCLSGDADKPCICDSFGSWHPSICQVVFSDGHVDSILRTIDTRTLDKLAHRSDGEIFTIE